jgi:hypothetical protein
VVQFRDETDGFVAIPIEDSGQRRALPGLELSSLASIVRIEVTEQPALTCVTREEKDVSVSGPHAVNFAVGDSKYSRAHADDGVREALKAAVLYSARNTKITTRIRLVCSDLVAPTIGQQRIQRYGRRCAATSDE